MPAADVCEKMIAVFTASDFSFDGLTGEGMTWAATGEVSKAPKGMVIQNGRLRRHVTDFALGRRIRYGGPIPFCDHPETMRRSAGLPAGCRK